MANISSHNHKCFYCILLTLYMLFFFNRVMDQESEGQMVVVPRPAAHNAELATAVANSTAPEFGGRVPSSTMPEASAMGGHPAPTGPDVGSAGVTHVPMVPVGKLGVDILCLEVRKQGLRKHILCLLVQVLQVGLLAVFPLLQADILCRFLSG